MSEFSEYMRLLPYGYAPGNYMSKCFACEKVVADVDKRATSCRPCAEAAFKNHEIERLRAEVAGLREWLEADARCPCCDTTDACVEGCTFATDCPQDAERMAEVRALLAARKGEA